MTAPPDTTQLLLDARAGDRDAFDRLYARVYDVLRGIAHQRLGRGAPGGTLDTTGLVHEAWLRLVDQPRAGLRDRAHFLALAARAMRFVVVDHARERAALKRGGGDRAVALDLVQVAADARAAELLALDEAVESLARASPRLSQVVELRFFGGLTFDEMAEATGLSVPTLKRDWTRARAWLHQAMLPVGDAAP